MTKKNLSVVIVGPQMRREHQGSQVVEYFSAMRIVDTCQDSMIQDPLKRARMPEERRTGKLWVCVWSALLAWPCQVEDLYFHKFLRFVGKVGLVEPRLVRTVVSPGRTSVMALRATYMGGGQRMTTNLANRI